MNFKAYGKGFGSKAIIGIPVPQNAYVPEKYWAHSKVTNRHDFFFKPQQEDLEDNGNKANPSMAPIDETMLTIKATSFFNCKESSLYLEGRGNASCEVGIAAIDIKRPELILSQISDNFWYTGLLTKIAILSPAEILLPQALINSNNRSKLHLYIKHTYPDVPINSVPRRQFNDKKALEIIDRIHNSKYQSIRNMIAKKYYALTASSALLQYLEYILNYNFAANSLKLLYEPMHGCMMIDLDTSHHLELLYPTCKTKEPQACLFGILNSCVTNIGKRNLRAQILQPSCDLKNITKIQLCVKVFLENQELFLALERTLMKFHSVDKLMKFAVVRLGVDVANLSEIMMTQALQLKSCLENIPELRRLLSTTKSSYFDDIKSVLSNAAYQQMLNQIIKVMHPDIQITSGSIQFFQRLHAINPNISTYLDLNRDNYTKLVDKINEIIGSLSITHSLPFQMKFITSKGFHIQLAISKAGQLPSLHSSFEILSKTKNTIILTTTELRMLNMRLFDVVHQIHIESNRIITELINCIRQNMSHLYDLAGLVSSLDIILSLAKYSINSNGCCPSFSSELNVIDGIHPLLEYNRSNTTPVPNGVIANGEYHFFVITGPNMGGKTVYLKMIALLQIMAQLGCFVPAKSARFRLTDKILSRIGFGDRIECNLSGFVLEMRETEYIFKNITPNSLVIIDELCRSTNPEEGEVLAWDICERFIRLIGVSDDGQYFDESENVAAAKNANKSIRLCSVTSPFIFFVTHFDSITKLQDKFLSVVNLHFSAKEEVVDGKTHIAYDYRIEDGINQIKNYGILLAQYMNLPTDVIAKATEISEKLRQQQLLRHNRSQSNIFNSSVRKRSTHQTTILETSTSEQSHILRLLYNLYADMVSINRMGITGEEKIKLLNTKMTELSGELPYHVLEMAKKGTLCEMFKPTSAHPINIQSPVVIRIDEKPKNDPIGPDTSRPATGSHDTTRFSLLSMHSIARRIGLELGDIYNKQPLSVLEISDPKVESSFVLNQSFEPTFGNGENRMDAMDFKCNFDESVAGKLITSGDVFSPFRIKDQNTDFMLQDLDLMDEELKLTQYFKHSTPKREIVLSGEPKMEDFFKCSEFVGNSGMMNKSDKLRTNPTLNIMQSAVSSKANVHSIGMSNKTFPSSSSSSGLFRLQLKEPVKLKDNRILRTPLKKTKNAPTAHGSKKREVTFRDLKNVTIEQQSSVHLDSKSLAEISNAQVPSNCSSKFTSKSTSFNDSHQKTFHLNLTQFCSEEVAKQRPFFDSTKNLFSSYEECTPSLRNDIVRIMESPQLFDTCDNLSVTNLNPIPRLDNFVMEMENTISAQKTKNYSANMSQKYSEKFSDLGQTNKCSNDVIHQASQLHVKQVIAPQAPSASGLQLIQLAYHSQSEDLLFSDDESFEDSIIEPSGLRPQTRKYRSSNCSKKCFTSSEKAQESLITPGITVQSGTVWENASCSQHEEIYAETAASGNASEGNENLDDIILPVPLEFL